MNFKQKLKDEIKAVVLVTCYFAVWLGILVLIKKLILAEYRIEFHGFSLALIGAIVLAKVVLVLEHLPIGRWIRTRPALIDVVLRTAMYSTGVALVLVLEKGFEGRHEHGGFGPALRFLFQQADVYHVWANTLCLSGALLVFNALSVVQRYLGKGSLMRIFMSPLAEEKKTEQPDTK